MAINERSAKRGQSATAHPTETTQAVALYARVSTEDQAERETIKAQLDFLRRFVELHGTPVAGEYIDDGISGTAPLDERQDGRRLLMDAETGRFGAVLVYRLDRLGRSLRALLDAHDALSGHGVAIRSATEPFDTSSPIGQFLFQLLGSLAELEKSTISERTSLGRNRVAGNGKYTGGPIPLGYDIDKDGLYVASERPMPGLDMSEAEYVRDMFRRIAAGETSLTGERNRLNALGVPTRKRFRGTPDGKRGKGGADHWATATLAVILHNPLYKGEAVVKTRQGEIARPAPALIDAATWDRAQAAILRARALATKNAKRIYLLRGLVRCAGCGATYVGASTGELRRYRCNTNYAQPHRRHDAKLIPADWLEAAVWDECRKFIMNPGDVWEQARRTLRERLATSAGFDKRRRTLLTNLADKETERERVLTMYRRGMTSLDEAERDLDTIAREAGKLREDLESLRAQAALIDAQESFLTESAAFLGLLRDELEIIEETNDLARKREIIEQFVRVVEVESRRIGPRKLEANIRVFLRLQPEPITVENVTAAPA